MAQNIDYAVAPIERIEADLGGRLERIRLGGNVSQSQLAREASVSRRTITRLENGEGISLDTLIRVMRALGLAERLGSLLPDPEVRPIERVRHRGRQRQRARPKKNESAAEWRWADAADRSDDTPEAS